LDYLEWIFVIFELKVCAYACVNHSGDEAAEKLPKNIDLSSGHSSVSLG